MKTLITIALVTLAASVAVVAAPISTAGSVTLDPNEKAELQYMREEEKLARDVYRALAAKWSDAAVFARIAQSEQRHMDAVEVVLDRYGVADPAAGKAAGVFSDPKLQALYDDLVTEGRVSLQAAYAVGMKIEKADIADLQVALAATDNADLERLYGNLLAASKNHLQAFTAHATGTVPSGGQGPGGGWQGDGTCDRQATRLGSGPVWGKGPGAGQRAAGIGW